MNWIDPYGLEIMVCNRRASGIVGKAGGNHAYLWDTRNSDNFGMQGSSGSGNHTNESGPANNSCSVVQNSAGHEDAIMDFMRRNADNGLWVPVINDCHNATGDAVESENLVYPGAPGGRVGSIP